MNVNGKTDYEMAKDAKDVDRISGMRIQALHGSLHGELRNLRKSLLALFVIQSPKSFSDKEIREAMNTGNELLRLNELVEGIVAEGRDYKKEKGW